MIVTCPQLGGCGRLGNQLWQIASTIGIAKAHGAEASFPAWDYQPFFCIPPQFFTGAAGIDSINFVPYMDDQAKSYLQDYALWRHCADEIKQWFQPSALAMETLESYRSFWNLEPPVLSLHVRRGDNATEGPWKADYHPLRPISYYLDALQMRDYQSVAVFSDDPHWCQETFGPSFFYFHGVPRPKEHLPEYRTAPVLDWIDLQLMSFCDSHIISNSTYSWWGAFLSDDPSPIYPAPWYGSKLESIDANVMFPPNWQRLDHG